MPSIESSVISYRQAASDWTYSTRGTNQISIQPNGTDVNCPDVPSFVIGDGIESPNDSYQVWADTQEAASFHTFRKVIPQISSDKGARGSCKGSNELEKHPSSTWRHSLYLDLRPTTGCATSCGVLSSESRQRFFFYGKIRLPVVCGCSQLEAHQTAILVEGELGGDATALPRPQVPSA